jgi:hypothetical protein
VHPARTTIAVLLLGLLPSLGLLAGGSRLGLAAEAQQPPVFERPGVSETDKRRDENECVRSAIRGRDERTGTRQVFEIDRAAYARCMEARGYIPRKASEGEQPR